MTIQDPSNNVIPMPRRGQPRHAEEPSRRRKSQARVIAITSGKGGVGKTNIVANLGFALSRLGKKVLILDADLGLGNLDVLLGVAPKFNISHVIRGDKTIEEILEEQVALLVEGEDFNPHLAVSVGHLGRGLGDFRRRHGLRLLQQHSQNEQLPHEYVSSE